MSGTHLNIIGPLFNSSKHHFSVTNETQLIFHVFRFLHFCDNMNQLDMANKN
jgi:hypothetical protein